MQMIFFELIQISIGKRTCLSHTPSAKEWKRLFRLAENQTLLGICFAGVKRLQEAQKEMPAPLFMQWLGIAAKIQQRNEEMDKKSAEVWTLLNRAGLDCAILKGQGVARCYNLRGDSLGVLRQSGDIDVWVKGGFDVVNAFVQRTRPTKDVAYHRFHYDLFADTEVELHHRPTLMRNLFDDRRLQQWCDSFGADSFVMTEKGFAVPPLSFNRIFILTHIYRHFLFEGIGLRQLMDYYFVLLEQDVDEMQVLKEKELLSRLKMMRFTEAVMWVLGHVLGLERKYMLCEPNEKEGRFILEEIMQTGNFGQGDKRYRGHSKMRRMTKHGLHLLMHYPSEVLWTPLWLIYHRVWKYNKKKL